MVKLQGIGTFSSKMVSRAVCALERDEAVRHFAFAVLTVFASEITRGIPPNEFIRDARRNVIF